MTKKSVVLAINNLAKNRGKCSAWDITRAVTGPQSREVPGGVVCIGGLANEGVLVFWPRR